MRGRGTLQLGASLAMRAFAVAGHAQDAPPSEYQIKAAFLYNFAKFVDWPRAAFADSLAPFVIGIAGEDPFGAEIDRTLDGKRVQGRGLAIRRFADPQTAAGCQILYVGSADPAVLRLALQSVAGSPVLTVGEAESFLDLGGIVRFALESNKVRFDIDPAAAEAAGLRISSKLLRLARILRGMER